MITNYPYEPFRKCQHSHNQFRDREIKQYRHFFTPTDETLTHKLSVTSCNRRKSSLRNIRRWPNNTPSLGCVTKVTCFQQCYLRIQDFRSMENLGIQHELNSLNSIWLGWSTASEPGLTHKAHFSSDFYCKLISLNKLIIIFWISLPF